MGRNRNVSIGLEYEVDLASMRRAVTSADTVEGSLVDAQRATERAANSARVATSQYEALGRTSQRLAQLASGLGIGPAAEVLGFGGDFADVLEDLSPKLAGVTARITSFGGQIINLVPGLAGLGAASTGLLAVLGPIALVAGAAAVGIAAVSSELQKQAAAARDYVTRMQEINDFLAQGGTSTEARRSIEQAERDANEAAMNIAEAGSLLRSSLQAAFGDTFMTLDVATAPIAQLASAVQDFSAITFVAAPAALEYAAAVEAASRAQADALQDIAAYGQAVLEGETADADAAAAAEEAADAQEELNEHLGELANRLGRVSPDVQKLNEELEATEAALQEAQEADAERKEAIIEVARDLTDDEAQIKAVGAQRLAEIEQRLTDARIQAAQQAAEESARALRQLEQQQASLATSLTRETDKEVREAQRAALAAQIDYQREDARNTRAHSDELLRIKESSADREFELLLASDFRGLYLLRRDRNKQLSESERTFGRERQERLIALKEGSDDRQAAFIAERQERIIQYQQNLADARTAYNQQLADAARQRQVSLQQAQAAHQREVTEQAAALQAQLTTRRAAAIAELTMLNQTEQQRLAITAAANQQYLALANQLLAGVGAVAGKAGMPSSVITNSRAATMNNTFNIQSGASAGTVAKAVDQQIAYRLQQVVGRGK